MNAPNNFAEYQIRSKSDLASLGVREKRGDDFY